MNSFLLKLNAPLTSTLIASFSLQTSCEVSKYGSKAKEMVIQSSSYVGEKSKSAYQVSKEKLGIELNSRLIGMNFENSSRAWIPESCCMVQAVFIFVFGDQPSVVISFTEFNLFIG